MSVKGFFGNLLRNIRVIRSSGSNWNNMNDWYYLKSLDFKRRMLIARHLTGAIARRLSGFAVEGLSGFIFSTGGGTHGPEKVSAKSEDEPVREGIGERTFRRYTVRYRDEGTEGLLDKRLGALSHNRAPQEEAPGRGSAPPAQGAAGASWGDDTQGRKHSQVGSQGDIQRFFCFGGRNLEQHERRKGSIGEHGYIHQTKLVAESGFGINSSSLFTILLISLGLGRSAPAKELIPSAYAGGARRSSWTPT